MNGIKEKLLTGAAIAGALDDLATLRLDISLGRYRTLTCATVVRPDDHLLRPSDYIPITRFLARTGFTRLSGVTTHFIWREIDDVKRDHPMQFWSKELL